MTEPFEDYYETLGLPQLTPTVKEIKTAWKQKIVESHPDKLKDKTDENIKNANERVDKITKAYKVLSDEKARAAFDGLLKAKQQAKKRSREMDDKRRQMKETLIANEHKAKRQKTDEESARRNFEAELTRLKKDGWKKYQTKDKKKKETSAPARPPTPATPAPSLPSMTRSTLSHDDLEMSVFLKLKEAAEKQRREKEQQQELAAEAKKEQPKTEEEGKTVTQPIVIS